MGLLASLTGLKMNADDKFLKGRVGPKIAGVVELSRADAEMANVDE